MLPRRMRFTVRHLLFTVALSTIPLVIGRGFGDRGRFLVVARTFRGPAARDYAEALASELREEHDLPAFSFAGHPRASDRAPAVGSSQEFSVAVGSYETMERAQAVKRSISRITLRCLARLPMLWANRLKPSITMRDRLP
jgi:hypothetical protein